MPSLAPLPVDLVLGSVVRAVETSGAAVLRAPTGAGKTTRVPPALLAAERGGRRMVLVLEPRRVAARAAARRMAEERGGTLGGEIGYQVRFQRKTSAATRLLVVTEGILLRMLQDDPLLERVGTVVFDEFHERSLSSDLALALVQRVRASVRDDLRVVVMSATMDPAPVAAFLGQVPVVKSEGRAHPVEVEYAPRGTDQPLEQAVRSAVLDAIRRGPGDVLVFLPGVGEIRRTEQALADAPLGSDTRVLALHGELPPERQDAALTRSAGRKVVLATNVAETSITIEGIRTVIDTGLERVPRVDPAVGLERLETVSISRESADQRAGRAGRTGPGLCIRLWSRGRDVLLEPRRTPEILRADLAGAALQLYAWGETSLASFPWFEVPPPASLEAADALLARLGAIEEGRLTDIGRRMARIPAQPRLARLLVAAKELGHPRRLALAAAVLSDRSPFARVLDPHRRGTEHHSSSDVLDAVEAVEAFERTGRLDAGVRPLRRGPARHALRLRDQFARNLPRGPSGTDSDNALRRAVFAAYPDRLARRRIAGSDRAVLVGGRGVRLAHSCSVREPELFVAVDVHAAAKGERAEALVWTASAVDRAWLAEDRLRTVEVMAFDAEHQAVVGIRQTRFEDLVLDEVQLKAPRGDGVSRALAEAAAEDLHTALPLADDAVASLRLRAACLAAWRPELGLPSLEDDAVRALLLDLARGRRSFAELRRAPLLDHLQGLFTWEQRQALDRGAPERIEVPSGSHVRLRYEEGRPPVLAVRIQEVFGLRETPRVASGRVAVLMHLLAPNHRPQQITDDMPSFWANTYPQIRKELRARYPKHAWPEDPLAAKPERRPPRRSPRKPQS